MLMVNSGGLLDGFMFWRILDIDIEDDEVAVLLPSKVEFQVNGAAELRQVYRSP